MEKPTFDLEDLRAVMEAVDGYREKGARVVLRDDRGKRRPVVLEGDVPDDRDGGEPLFVVAKRESESGVGKNAMFPLPKVEVTLPEQGRTAQIDLNEDADALFWSRAAIDKFVRPYYARLHPGDWLMKNLDAAVQDENTLAILHCCRTVYLPITGPAVSTFAALRETREERTPFTLKFL